MIWGVCQGRYWKRVERDPTWHAKSGEGGSHGPRHHCWYCLWAGVDATCRRVTGVGDAKAGYVKYGDTEIKLASG